MGKSADQHDRRGRMSIGRLVLLDFFDGDGRLNQKQQDATKGSQDQCRRGDGIQMGPKRDEVNEAHGRDELHQPVHDEILSRLLHAALVG